MASRQSAIALTIPIFITIISSSMASVHDILPLYGLPKGLLPKEIKSCCLSNADDSFSMELAANPCYVEFEGGQMVHFDRIVKGKLGTGKVSSVSGIKAKKLFVWVNVDGIVVDGESGMIEFRVGAFSQSFAAKDFERIRSCRRTGAEEDTHTQTRSLM